MSTGPGCIVERAGGTGPNGGPVSETPTPTPSWRDDLPGLLLAVGVMLLATWTADAIGVHLLGAGGATGKKNPLSSITVAIVLGLLWSNTLGVPAACRPGLKVALKQVLKLGIILVGLKLSFLAVFRLGAVGVPFVACVIGFALVVTDRMARALGLSENLGALAAASTAICGVTATVAVAGVIDAEDDEVAYTVANVTLFGMTAMLVYPYLAHLVLGASPQAVGLFLGTAVHDTAQVMGAALAYRELFNDEVAFQVATVTKLTRNVFLVAVVPYLAMRHAHRQEDPAQEVDAWSHFPVFVLGFLGLALLRTAGDAYLAGASPEALASWTRALKFLGGTAASACLATAMAAVGLSTRLGDIVRQGWRPFGVGLGAALAVGALSLGMAYLAGPWVPAP